MRIGIVPTLKPYAGGVHQYTLTILEGLAELSRQGSEEEYILFLRPEDRKYLTHLNDPGWDRALLQPPPPLRVRVLNMLRSWVGERKLRQIWRAIRPMVLDRPEILLPNPNRVRKRPEVGQWFRQYGVDWVFYTAGNVLSFEAGVPYLMPLHDLQHLLQPEFPEESTKGRAEGREYLYRNGARYATLILADSEVGKEDILELYGRYGVTPDRIKILPFLPANYLSKDVPEEERVRVRHTYRLPERFLFYPAQFWPHKNHRRIVQALGLLKEEGYRQIHVAFCGAHTSDIRERNFQEVMQLAGQLSVADRVHYLGYVPDADMSGLYAEALGLVMPTFFGPTNIPMLEAWAFGCPVLTSDLRGIREQAGDAGLLVDPRSVEAIAAGIRRLWEDETLREELAERGRRRLARYTWDDFRHRLADIVQEVNERVREGDNPIHALGT